MSIMPSIQIAGYNVPVFHDDPGWIPETNIVLTPTTNANLKKILPAMVQNRPLLLVGDAGVGKNALIYYINSLRKHPTIRYSFNEDTLPEDLVGSYRLDPTTHGFVWSDGPLSQAMRQGSTFVADEMNLASPEVLKRFQSIFSENYLEMLEGDATRIDPAPGFQFVATQNPAEGFEGRKNLPREIQKYFVTVYLDPYPMVELVEILKGLFADVPEDVLKAIVHINRDVEDAVIRKKIGSRDLERYHFNLRNLARLTRRIQQQPQGLYQELSDVYLRPFRTTEDHVEIKGVFDNRIKEFGLAGVVERKHPPVELAANSDGRFSIGRAILDLKEFHSEGSAVPDADAFKANLEKATESFVPVPARADILESIARAIQFRENVLLEGDSDVEPDEYVRFFANALGRDLHVVTLSRGMHTADVMGGLKPASNRSDGAAVDWVDGPLTRAVKNGEFILIQGLEAAGPELVEKLNMLMDDARALMLPPESGSNDPVFLPPESRIFGIKFFRSQRTSPTVSRAFRNRFTCYTIPAVEDPESLRAILRSHLELEPEEAPELVKLMQQFHTTLREKARKREIGAANLQPYRFGLTNLARFTDSVGWAVVEPENLTSGMLKDILAEGAGIAYLHEIADPVEREKMFALLDALLDGQNPDALLDGLKTISKKKALKERTHKSKIWWDQDKHWREANTGKAKWNLDGRDLKEGINIDTPETGGETKEGPDAWYGQDTQGNKGVGDPGQGGGAWGYRSEELYQEFLKKRKILWDYNIGVSLEDFKEVFGPEIDRVTVDLDRFMDPDIQINRRYESRGSRVDARKYLSYLAGRSDGRIFDRTTINIDEDRLKGVEVLFALNKGRRIFNFEYSIATLVALMSSAEILSNHRIPFGVVGYSDLKNSKVDIDMQWFKNLDPEYGPQYESHLFSGIAQAWHGDTIPESHIMEELSSYFSSEARTRILVVLSDFRGSRGKVNMEADLRSHETKALFSEVEKLKDRGLVMLGVGLGPRAIADQLFPESLSIARENYANLPGLLASSITEMIHRYHSATEGSTGSDSESGDGRSYRREEAS